MRRLSGWVGLAPHTNDHRTVSIMDCKLLAMLFSTV